MSKLFRKFSIKLSEGLVGSSFVKGMSRWFIKTWKRIDKLLHLVSKHFNFCSRLLPTEAFFIGGNMEMFYFMDMIHTLDFNFWVSLRRSLLMGNGAYCLSVTTFSLRDTVEIPTAREYPPKFLFLKVTAKKLVLEEPSPRPRKLKVSRSRIRRSSVDCDHGKKLNYRYQSILSSKIFRY